MYGLDGAAIPIYQVLPCLVIECEFQLATPEERQKLAQTPEKRETLHMFAVSLTQRGRGMVHNNSSNLTREPEPDGRRSFSVHCRLFFRFEGHLAGDFHFGPQTPEKQPTTAQVH